MEYLQQLLHKYHKGKASAAERAELLFLLEQQGADLQHSLEAAFGEGTDKGKDLLLPADRSAAILRNLHEQMEITGVAPVSELPVKMWSIKWMTGIAAALLLALAGWQWMHAAEKEEASAIAARQPAAAPLQLLRNGTGQKETLLLPDSSVVVLSPGSVLSFAKQFDSLHRNIYLQGEACFSVVKDAKRPFTVYANGVATTALGTRFSVSTFYSNEQVRVRLMEGKVVVRMQEQQLAMHPVYLSPGQECMMNKRSGEALVQAFQLQTPAGKTNLPGNNIMPAAGIAALEFTREPLVNVFKRVEKLYHVTIAYRGVTLDGLSFTGNFLPSDSLPVVLSIICKTNDLSFEQKEALITITSLP